MRFSLQDVKKQVRRRDNDLYITLHFLRPGELRKEIERLVAYFEQLLNLAQRQFSIDEARSYMDDYRLAHCLISTLSAWYSWQQRNWEEVLAQFGGACAVQLEAAGINSPVQLRLALFTYVNEHYSGFLDRGMRIPALQAFAEMYSLSVSQLEYLLTLDSDEEALLVRNTPAPPSADEVAALYNQWAFEAALFNASDVHFMIDCNAFGNVQNVVGVGAVIKRLCYLARKLGVYYDLAYDMSAPAVAPLLDLTLYGPQEVTGAPQQYGLRLARLCRMLLGYGISRPSNLKGDAKHNRQNDQGRQGDHNQGGEIQSGPNQGERDFKGDRKGGEIQSGPNQGERDFKGDRKGRPYYTRNGSLEPAMVEGNFRYGAGRPSLVAGAIYKAEATIHFLQRSYRFSMDAELLNLLPSARETNVARAKTDASSSKTSIMESVSETTASPSSSVFDSSIEQSFAEAFSALESSHGVEGWRLEREPEPLLAGQSIFIPDFALTRGNRRIYVEILGFWTPGYRERKIAKLQQLKERDDLVLAIPQEARDAFASIAALFPIVWYEGQLSATELLQVLRNNYDNFEERLALIDVQAVQKRVLSEGLVPERVCYEVLHCYRRSELQQAAERIITGDIAFTPGIGLYAINWLERLRGLFVEWWGEVAKDGAEHLGKVPLTHILREAKERWPELTGCEDATVEAILDLWPEIRIQRDSIFEPMVEVVDQEGVNGEESYAQEKAALMMGADVPKKAVRERRTIAKKRVVRETEQGSLWG